MNELTHSNWAAVFAEGRQFCASLDRRGVTSLLKMLCDQLDRQVAAQAAPCAGLVSTCARLRGLLDTPGWTSAQVSTPPDARQHGLTVGVTWAKPAARRGLTPMQKWQRKQGVRR